MTAIRATTRCPLVDTKVLHAQTLNVQVPFDDALIECCVLREGNDGAVNNDFEPNVAPQAMMERFDNETTTAEERFECYSLKPAIVTQFLTVIRLQMDADDQFASFASTSCGGVLMNSGQRTPARGTSSSCTC